MSVQQLRDHIITALERYFPDVPVYVEGDKPESVNMGHMTGGERLK